jgi:zinc finger protein-like protein
MAVPVDAVTAIHNAFRADMATIDIAALGAAQGKSGLEATIERFRFFNEVLEWHAHGEEVAIFTALEEVAPLVAWAFDQDHRGLDAAFAELNRSVSVHDPLGTARATAAFKFHLDLHLSKEDRQVYRLIQERVSMPDQGKAVAAMAQSVPQDRFPEVVAWMYPLIGDDDRENMTRIWQQVMPPQAFAGAVGLIRQALGDDFTELQRRIPDLVTVT